LREADECPGIGWELVSEVLCDGVVGKLWRRKNVPVSLACVICGNEYMWSTEADKCPHCHSEVPLGL
jgi:Zn finger protein HypA/HybF involved in hydrogenase expression